MYQMHKEVGSDLGGLFRNGGIAKAVRESSLEEVRLELTFQGWKLKQSRVKDKVARGEERYRFQETENHRSQGGTIPGTLRGQ